LYAIFWVTALNSRNSLKPLLNQAHQCSMLLNSADNGDDRKAKLKPLLMGGKYLQGLSSWEMLFSRPHPT
jgi:hypothetical protein